MDNIEQMTLATRTLLELVINNLCDSPNKSDITIDCNGANSCLICVKVSAKDYGKVIGQKGKIVKAIRSLLQAFAGKYRVRFLFEIVEME